MEFEIARAGASEVARLDVPVGTPLRVALRRLGYPAEGCAVLEGENSVPLDLPVTRAAHFVLIPTFSGG